jgi:Ankyrin repeat
MAAGADMKVQSKGSFLEAGGTPLHWAAKNGHVEICKILIAAGADVNSQDIVSFFEVGVAFTSGPPITRASFGVVYDTGALVRSIN